MGYGYPAQDRVTGAPPCAYRATCGWVLAQKKNMGSTLIWRVCKGFVLCEWESVWGRSAVNPTNLALVTQNVNSLMEKQPELVFEVEKYQRDIVVLASTKSLGSEISLLLCGWTLYHSRAALDYTQQT